MTGRGFLMTCLVLAVLPATYCVPRAWAQATDDKGPVRADVVLRQGLIHDGTGEPPRVGDVAIAGDRIVAVGQFALESVGREIDCRGLVIAPGFIDLHNHSDQQVVDHATRACVNYLMQGCTTVVTGNCGSGPIDVQKYYEQIEQGGVGANVAHLMPQGSIRSAVLGTENRPASDEEVARMKEIVERGMQAGAWGMSSGLIYVPSSYASTDELVELARVVAEHQGIYASHIRGENTQLLDAVNEALEIGRRAELPVHISHFKSSGQDAWGLVRVAIELIEKQRQAGQVVTADQYPYVASSTSLNATLLPTWALAGGQKSLLARLDDPQQAGRIREAMAKKLTVCDEGRRVRIASYKAQPQWAGKSLWELAQQEQVEPLELAERIVRSGGAGIVNFSMTEPDVRLVMSQPWVATASDGRATIPSADVPHPRSYGTFPRKIGYYAFQEQAVTAAQAIRSATGLPADILGLRDRGYLRPDAAADVVVLDPESFRDKATFEAPHQYAEGVRLVFVNGQPAVSAGIPTGALAGRPLKHAGPQKDDGPQKHQGPQKDEVP